MSVEVDELIGPLAALGLYPKKKIASYVQDNFTLSPLNLSEKKITLSKTPADPLKVSFVPYRGIEQEPGVDFIVTGNELSWDGLALELLLEVGDRFSVRYLPNSP